MELSELTNKELKGILRENQVKNYSKLNKKELVKKVNQLTREQNGGKSGKGKNGKKKKYTLKDLIGGLVTNGKSTNQVATSNLTVATAPPLQNSASATAPPLQKSASAISNLTVATAPLYSKEEQAEINNTEKQRQLSLESQVNNKGKNECGACSIQ